MTTSIYIRVRHEQKKFLSSVQQVHPVQRSVGTPMKLLLKDEKQKSETMGILFIPCER